MWFNTGNILYQPEINETIKTDLKRKWFSKCYQILNISLLNFYHVTKRKQKSLSISYYLLQPVQEGMCVPGCYCASLPLTCPCSQWDIKGLKGFVESGPAPSVADQGETFTWVAFLICSSLESDCGERLNLMKTYSIMFFKEKFGSVLVLKSRMRRVIVATPL